MTGEQRTPRYFSHAQEDLNLRILRMFEGTFSLDAVHLLFSSFNFRIRKTGNKFLHTKGVLLLIVILNGLDCLLVLSELVLDVHFIKCKSVL